MSEATEERLFASLIKNPDISWVATGIGRWDLCVGFATANIIEFAQHKDAVIKQLGTHVKDYDITHIEDALIFNRDYLIGTKTVYRNHFEFGGSVGSHVLTPLEKGIICEREYCGSRPADESEQLFLNSTTCKNADRCGA